MAILLSAVIGIPLYIAFLAELDLLGHRKKKSIHATPFDPVRRRA